MSTLKWIECFISGKRTASNGLTRDYTIDELDQVVGSYNPKHFKAPLIVSYPAHNTAGYTDGELHKSQLAFGYPEQLKRVGDRLYAGFQKISPKIKEWIDNGNILGFSSSFYLPNSPHNPYPGQWSLRHIASCGVDPPAVKGMTAPEWAEPLSNFADYAEDQEGCVEFSLDLDPETLEYARVGAKVYQSLQAVATASFMDFMGGLMSPVPLASLFRDFYQRLRDRHIEEQGLESAEQLYPLHVLDQLGAFALQPQQPYPTYEDVARMIDAGMEERSQETHQYQEIETEDESVSQELEARIAQLEQRNQELEATMERERVASFVEKLVSDRKLHSRDAEKEVRFILNLDNETTADYGEGEELTARAAYMNKLASGRELWSDKRLPIGPEDAPEFGEGSGIVGFSAPDGCDVDHESAQIYRKAADYCSKQGWDARDPEKLLRAVELTSSRR